MNDLLFTSGNHKLPYVDLQKDTMDFEAQTEMANKNTENNLAEFFRNVDSIKEDMEAVKGILSQLQKANTESQGITSAKAMKTVRDRMDRDVDRVLRMAKTIKHRLEDLDRANAESQTIHGCEQGSSTDRTRTSITNSLRSTLKDLMADFRALREKMMSEYKETIERRYFTVTGKHPDEETIDMMIENGESETFLQKAIQEQGRGHIMDTILEIQERHEAVKEVERSLIELHQIFLDMSVLVEAQGGKLNDIEAHVHSAHSFVNRGTQALQTAKKLQRNSRKCMCIAVMILLIIMLVLIVPVLITLIPTHS